MEIQQLIIILFTMKGSIKHTITVVCDTQYEQTIEVNKEEEVKASYFIFSNNQATSCKVQVNLMWEKSSADIKLFSIIHNAYEVIVDGTIYIDQSANHASGHLQEEILLIWWKGFTTTKPILDVRNNDVSASHGAKIHNFNPNNLFYLMSRWLSEMQSKEVVLKGFIDSLFDLENSEIKIIWASEDLISKPKEELITYIIEKISKNILIQTAH